MNNSTMTILAFVLTVFLSSLDPCFAGELWDRIRETKSQHEAEILIKSLSTHQILDLCNEYGEEVERGREKGNPFIVNMSLHELRRRGELSQELLLGVVSNHSNSSFWRIICAKYSADYRILGEKSISIDVAYKGLSAILVDKGESDSMKLAAAYACSNLLMKSYYYLLAKEGEKGEKGKRQSRKDLKESIWKSTAEGVLKNDARVIAMYDLVLSGELSDEIICRGLWPLWGIPGIRKLPEGKVKEMILFLKKKDVECRDKEVKQSLERSIREISKAAK